MFIDASVLTAIVREAEADEFVARIEQAGRGTTSPMAVWEAAIAIARILGMPPRAACQGVLAYLRIADIELVTVPADP